jgi:hypothetical protein
MGAEPKLTVAKPKLRAALKCSGDLRAAKHTPLMLVTGTGASGDEAYAIGKPALDLYGAPICWVNFPHHTTGDIQVAVQYLVGGLRTMSHRADRRVAMFGISQGGLLARMALTYWPSLRPHVSDVIAAAGTQHGTTVGSLAPCRRHGCPPADWQQAAGSRLLAALNRRGRDETPGPTAWTTVRSSTDATVRPTGGRHPTSALAGATNVLIQSVCPGRRVTHIGTGLDSVTYALIHDAIAHRGPAKVSRLAGDVCAAESLTAGRGSSEPKVRREPRVRAWVRRRS